MKKRLIILMIFAAILMLTSCAAEAEVVPPRVEETAAPKETLPESLPQLEGIEKEDIAYIEYWNESADPCCPDVQFAAEEDVSALFGQLKSLRRTSSNPLGEEDFAPGAGGEYVLYLFNGEKISVNFHLDCVLIGDEFYPCDSRPEYPEQPILLRTHQPSYPTDTENIEYTAYNSTEEKYAIQLMPQVERMTKDGWEKLEYGDIGFCGTPDPFPPSNGTGIIDFFSPSWFEEMSAGTYHLSLYYFKDGEEYLISTIFTLE